MDRRRSTDTDSSGFAARVIAWQRVRGRHDLPWQNTRDPYRIWLSEIMLQQTQVATVLPYYTRFVGEFPAVEQLAAAPLGRVLELWSGLGYYRRAHHLHAAARGVVKLHDGQFPVDAATLTTLPGIGRSTAAAIGALANGERGAILDGNVKRVLARHRGVDGWPGEPCVQAQLWRIAEALLPPRSNDSLPSAAGFSSQIAAYTQGLMDLGATVCTRTRPKCDSCPVTDDCIARRDARIEALPSPRPRKVRPQRAVIALMLERDGQILLEQRPPAGIWGGLWSFPELPPDSDVAAYVAQRFQAWVGAIDVLPTLTHVFTHFALTMHPRRVPITRWPARAQTPGVEWFACDTAVFAAVPAPIRKMLLHSMSSCRRAVKI